MKFITVMSEAKALEFISNLNITNNLLFDFPSNVLEEVKSKLEGLTGLSTLPVLGMVVSDTNGNLSESWKEISNLLPVKTGDVIFQFSIKDDEMLYGEFNKVMALLYNNSYFTEEVFEYELPEVTDCIALASEVELSTFECAYVVNDDWGRSQFRSSGSCSSIQELKELCTSDVWR